ncbi:hypothetical protein Hamer_G009968 [Homarus americanus]|uniref:Uncharacterized protein n=1 Tax=Homarus americanus TaxID=6706 RepID=A0A8J5JME8_HOMAM|nr:hypothetical protein Hamer_G009968 [Homarus americanus]
MQQQQQAAEEATRADRAAMQALIAQVLQLRGKAAPCSNTSQALPRYYLREFKVWRSAWPDYEELLQLRKMLHRTQLAHFKSCLTPEMRSTLAHAIGVPVQWNKSSN